MGKTLDRDRAGRRTLLKGIGALGVTATLSSRTSATAVKKADVAIVGAGVFGTWCADKLQRAGKRVTLIDALSPAHSRASSGGESRVTRCGYGSKQVYSEWSWSSLADWQALSARSGLPIFHPLGVLWIHRAPDELVQASTTVLKKLDIPHRLLSARELRERYPVMKTVDGEAGFLEPRAGGLMARRSVQRLAAELESRGVTLARGRVQPIRRSQGKEGALSALTTSDGRRIDAEQFVIACGPWLDRICPEAMAGRLFPTRQEVLYFGAGAAATGALPVWADLPFYGLPSIEGRGFKVADDTHGAAIDPDSAHRRPSAAAEEKARGFLARRFPSLADAPLVESRVCQYENSSDGHLVIDRHPGLDNVWLVGCGSGHGFKLGPAVGSHVAELVTGKAKPREPFLLAQKERKQDRAVQ
ncbi:hypothetical protein ABI59_08445 [Acidobacteria bacterium Mor1]|nr:hypothetical protein ABI59_08445 [Acidobacteria bacterium Mor1]